MATICSRMLLNPCLSFILLKVLGRLLLLQLSLVIGSAACDPLQATDVTTQHFQLSATSTNFGGVRAALIHRDHFSLHSSTTGSEKTYNWSPAAEASRSLRRAKSLGARSRRRNRGRLLAETAGPSSGPAGQPVDWETPLSDRSDDEYLMEISLGTPAQTFVAVADTGSDLTWLQSKPCQNCFRQSEALYDPSKSSTYSPLSCSSSACEFLSAYKNCDYSPSAVNGTDCQYSYAYGDASQTTGTLALDTINVDILEGGMQSVPSFWFGCSHNAVTSSGLFDATDGLVGLGRGPISFPSQLGQYFGNKFSYCLVNRCDTGSDSLTFKQDQNKAQVMSLTTGALFTRSRRAIVSSPLIFGDDSLSAAIASGGPAFQFTPLIDNPVAGFSTFYYVNLQGISLNGVEAPFPADAFTIAANGSGGTFFDSGTTYTSLVSSAFDSLVDAVSRAITGYDREVAREFELCYGATWDTWVGQYGKQVPSLSFNFANANANTDANANANDTSSFALGVASAWVQYDESVICLAILRGSDQNIFGNVQQVDYHIIYDLENLSIGFAPAVCENDNNHVYSAAQSRPRSATVVTPLLHNRALDTLGTMALIFLIHVILLYK